MLAPCSLGEALAANNTSASSSTRGLTGAGIALGNVPLTLLTQPAQWKRVTLSGSWASYTSQNAHLTPVT